MKLRSFSKAEASHPWDGYFRILIYNNPVPIMESRFYHCAKS